jgi:hypothetical protein
MTDTAANQSGNAGMFSGVLPQTTEPPVSETKAPDSVEAVVATMAPEERAKLELESLKKKATLMGVTYSNNIGVEALRTKIQEKIAGDSAAAQSAAVPSQAQVNALNMGSGSAVEEPVMEPEPEETPISKPMNARQQMLAEQMKLIRCRIVNLDPKKKDLPGEIISVANERLGNVRKFIPFGEATENGYHIPYVIYKLLKKRKFLQIRTRRDPRTGTNVTTQAWVTEFSIDVLDPLTKEQLRDLAQAQIAAGSIDNNSI